MKNLLLTKDFLTKSLSKLLLLVLLTFSGCEMFRDGFGVSLNIPSSGGEFTISDEKYELSGDHKLLYTVTFSNETTISITYIGDESTLKGTYDSYSMYYYPSTTTTYDYYDYIKVTVSTEGEPTFEGGWED